MVLRSLASGGGLDPCRAHLSGKGGCSLGDILLLWLNLGPFDLHVAPLNLLVSCTYWLDLGLSVHESGKNIYPYLFSTT